MIVCTPALSAYCFAVLEAKLKKQPVPTPEEIPNLSFPLFVSWHANTSGHAHTSGHTKGHGQLRGCIGNFFPLPLRTGLAEYALIRQPHSSLKDHRFPPISLPELPTLTCTVSLLIDFTPGQDYLDWTLGTHGIRITLAPTSSHASALTATYLPEIASEQGWTKEETIHSLVRKAGYSGPITQDLLESRLSLERYRSEVATLSFAEYADHYH